MATKKLFDEISIDNFHHRLVTKVANHWASGMHPRAFFKPYSSGLEFAQNSVVPITGFVINMTLTLSAIPVVLGGILGMAAGVATHGVGKLTKSERAEEAGVSIANYSAGLLFTSSVNLIIAFCSAFYNSAMNIAALATGSYTNIKNLVVDDQDTKTLSTPAAR